ncbi:aerotolerance regulator BatA, partial [Vibrio sp. 10N.222.49.C9]
MVEFEYPLAFLLALLPLLVYRFVPAYKESKSALQVPFFERLVSVSEDKPSQSATLLKRRKIQWALVVISYLSL